MAYAEDQTLLGIRKEFVRASRRYDLITNGDISTAADNGANFYINSGIRWLDLNVRSVKSRERHFATFASGEFYKTFEGLMTIDQLLIKDLTEGTVNDITLDLFEWDVFREEVPETFAEWDTGEPKYWVKDVIGPAQNADPSAYTDVDSMYPASGEHYDLTGLLFYPKADGAYELEITGRTKAPRMTADADYNQWTVEYPELVVMSACLAHERTMKNIEGMRTWREAMMSIINEIDNQLVEYEMSGHKMERE